MVEPRDSSRGEKIRNRDLDIVKGMLVLMMVVYHCASMALSANRELRIITNNMAFLHVSFLLITGFLCGWYYFPELKNSQRNVRKRLRVRAAKIMGVFLVLNMMLYSSGYIFSFEKLTSSLKSINDVLDNLVISMNGDLVAVEILFYISLFLLVASILIGRTTIPLMLALLIGASIIGCYSVTILFVAFGMVGMFFGALVAAGHLNKAWEWAKRQRGLPPALLIIYLSCLPKIKWVISTMPHLQLAIHTIESVLYFATFLTVITLFVNPLVPGVIILLGKYTLFSYLVQMLIVRVGYMVIQKMGIYGFRYYFINLLASGLILYLTVALLDKLRSRYLKIDGLYRAVFV